MELPKEINNYTGKRALIVDQSSTKTGYVVLTNDLFETGLIKLSGTVYDRVRDLFEELNTLIENHNIELLVFEGSTIFTHRSKNARVLLCHVHYRLEETAHYLGIPSIEVHSPTVRSMVKDVLDTKERIDKAKIRMAVEKLFKLKEIRWEQDIIDAMMIAYTFCKKQKKYMKELS